MQWLIDIVTSLFDDRHRYYDRGDPGAWDFQAGDFIQDNTWRDLDLSGIIPANVVSVHFHITMETTVINTAFNLRTKGNVNVHNVTRSTCVVARVRSSFDILVTPDSNGFVQYKAEIVVWTRLNLVVAGWWLK